jgi:ankyrin repeat protein
MEGASPSTANNNVQDEASSSPQQGVEEPTSTVSTTSSTDPSSHGMFNFVIVVAPTTSSSLSSTHITNYCCRCRCRSRSHWFVLHIKGVDTRDFEENTPLIIAAGEGQYDTVKHLLEQGAHPDSQNIYGYTALLSALARGHLQVALLLLQYGANVHLCSLEVCLLFFCLCFDHLSTFFKPQIIKSVI